LNVHGGHRSAHHHARAAVAHHARVAHSRDHHHACAPVATFHHHAAHSHGSGRLPVHAVGHGVGSPAELTDVPRGREPHRHAVRRLRRLHRRALDAHRTRSPFSHHGHHSGAHHRMRGGSRRGFGRRTGARG